MDKEQQFEEYLKANEEQLKDLTVSARKILENTEAAAKDFQNFKENSFFPSQQQVYQINNRLIPVEKNNHIDFRKTIEYTVLKWCAIINSIILFLFFILLITI